MKKTNIFLLVLASVVIFFSIGFMVRATEGDTSSEDNIAEVAEIEEVPVEVKPSPDWLPNLETKLKEFWGEDINKIGFVYYDLENGDKLAFNQDRQFIAASTYKVGLNMVAYDMVKSGGLSLDEGVRYKSSDFEGGTGILQGQVDTTLTKPVPVQKLLDLALTHSDNIATNMISRRMGSKTSIRQKTNDMVGLKCETKKNMTTPEIQYRLLRKLYENKEDTYYAHMLDVLKQTVFHDRMDKYLPYEIVAHKIGTYSTAIIDMGIVDTEHPYIFVMYTNSLSDADEKIAQTSKLVYDEQLIKY